MPAHVTVGWQRSFSCAVVAQLWVDGHAQLKVRAAAQGSRVGCDGADYGVRVHG